MSNENNGSGREIVTESKALVNQGIEALQKRIGSVLTDDVLAMRLMGGFGDLVAMRQGLTQFKTLWGQSRRATLQENIRLVRSARACLSRWPEILAYLDKQTASTPTNAGPGGTSGTRRYSITPDSVRKIIKQ